ncbi:MAG: hypothetical protein AB2693_02545 [Candidatus Thiodiazotropha sp.]
MLRSNIYTGDIEDRIQTISTRDKYRHRIPFTQPSLNWNITVTHDETMTDRVQMHSTRRDDNAQ